MYDFFCDVQECQKICINCEVEGKYWDKNTKLLKCPWLNNIKIMDQSIPEAPKIRGYPGDGKILVEWKKPFDGRSRNNKLYNTLLRII